MSKRYVGATEVAYTVADLLACIEALTRGLDQEYLVVKTGEMQGVSLALEEETLTDKSVIYNVVLDA